VEVETMSRHRASSESGDAEFEKRVSEVIKRLVGFVEHYYPHPLPPISIPVPFEKDEISVILPDRVLLPVIFSPSYSITATAYISNSQKVKKIEIRAFAGKVQEVALVGYGDRRIFVDPYGDIGFTYLAMPELLKAIRGGATIQSWQGHGDRWLTDFLATIEEVRGYSDIDAVKAVSPKELLNTSGMVRYILLDIKNPARRVSSAITELTINRRKASGQAFGRFATRIYFNGSYYGHVEFDYDGDQVKYAREPMFFGVDEKTVKRYVASILSDSLLGTLEREVAKFLDAYKYLRLALSIMEQ